MREKEPLSQAGRDTGDHIGYESIRPATDSELAWMGATGESGDPNLRKRVNSTSSLPLKFKSNDGHVQQSHEALFDNDFDSLDYSPIVSTSHLRKTSARCYLP